MKIALFGSTGFVGKVLLEKALQQGFQVITLARSPEKLGALKDKVEVIQGDIFQPDKIEECLQGVKAVLSTVPPEARTEDPGKYERNMDEIIRLMKKNGVRRLVHIGGAAHGGGENEQWSLQRRLLRLFLNLTWKPGLFAKQLEWEAMKRSGIDWTLIRPPRVIKGKSVGKLAADDKKLIGAAVNVNDLAAFMLEQIESKEWIGRAPLVSTIKR